MTEISGDTPVRVWLAAVRHLLDRGAPYKELDVFLKIAHPLALPAPDRRAYDLVDAFLTQDERAQSIHTIAETIFPYSYYRRGGVKAVFEDYPRDIEDIRKSRQDIKWGTYALRMLRRADGKGKVYNPLEHKLDHLKKHAKMKACFELDLVDVDSEEPSDADEACAIADLATYDDRADRRQIYGGLPCMSHLSITVFEGALHINATYRRHYYVERLLGNLVGLSRLQYALSRETDLKQGGLAINSTLAELDHGQKRWMLKEVRQLTDAAEACFDKEREAA